MLVSLIALVILLAILLSRAAKDYKEKDQQRLSALEVERQRHIQKEQEEKLLESQIEREVQLKHALIRVQTSYEEFRDTYATKSNLSKLARDSCLAAIKTALLYHNEVLRGLRLRPHLSDDPTVLYNCIQKLEQNILELQQKQIIVETLSTAAEEEDRKAHEQRRRPFDQSYSGRSESSRFNINDNSTTSRRDKTAHEILGISIDATQEDITVAYRQMAKMYHPDKVATLATEFRELAEMRMKEINLAYEKLKQTNRSRGY